MHDHTTGSTLTADAIFAVPFVLALILYLSGVVIQIQCARPWPWHRTVTWVLGVVAAASGFVGPLAEAAHDDFVAHMGAHLLVGMVAPLLLVAAAPMTLALRTLHVTRGRRLSRLLTGRPARFVTSPVVAGVLNVGGVWLLYSTPLFQAMQADVLVHLVVMTHFLVAGYLFTVAIVPIDPAPHRARYVTRMVVLVVVLAAHSILAKTIYAHPPDGVDIESARAGAMLMYYGGDLVDLVLVTVLCAQWYRDTGRRLRRAVDSPRSEFGADAGETRRR